MVETIINDISKEVFFFVERSFKPISWIRYKHDPSHQGNPNVEYYKKDNLCYEMRSLYNIRKVKKKRPFWNLS